MIKDAPAKERPRERLRHSGPESLSLRELIALLLGSGPKGKGCLGVAKQLLQGSNHHLSPWEEEQAFFLLMEGASPAPLAGIKGLGPAGIARLCAAFELGRRYARFADERQRLASKAPESIDLTITERRALLLISPELRAAATEWLGFVPLYKSGQLGELCIVDKGTRTHVNIDPQELFARILQLRPDGIFLFHNHPSGILRASDADQDLTERVDTILSALGIELLGHLIVTAKGSLRLPSGI